MANTKKPKQKWSNYYTLLNIRQAINDEHPDLDKIGIPRPMIVKMINVIEASFNLLVNPQPGQHYNLVHKAMAEFKKLEND